ncbi:MAG: hypothetical protein QOD44_559 [Solirubrobacteraceae bacterium]|jgi:uncharacterized membrane protein|nr:hypothetical protein [Solirubrobacteraceae bacterium]
MTGAGDSTLSARAPRVAWRVATATDNPTPPRRRLARLRPIKLPPPANPALIKHAEARADSFGNGIADVVTRSAGSMQFVYLHVLWFGCWIGFGVESYPFGLLTMIVSLEAIFLSTFVMISQNRAGEKQQLLADQEWKTVQEEDEQNEELLVLSHQILALTKELHPLASDGRGRGPVP